MQKDHELEFNSVPNEVLLFDRNASGRFQDDQAIVAYDSLHSASAFWQ
jgi:hypothetical protein